MNGVTVHIADGKRDLPVCRRTIEQVARDMGFEGNDLGDIVSAVFEACVNAFIHTRAATDEPVILTIHPLPDRFEAVVKDTGSGFAHSDGDGIPPPSSIRGRGIPLMKALMDEVRFEQDDGCRVTLVKKVARRGSGC